MKSPKLTKMMALAILFSLAVQPMLMVAEGETIEQGVPNTQGTTPDAANDTTPDNQNQGVPPKAQEQGSWYNPMSYGWVNSGVDFACDQWNAAPKVLRGTTVVVGSGALAALTMFAAIKLWETGKAWYTKKSTLDKSKEEMVIKRKQS